MLLRLITSTKYKILRSGETFICYIKLVDEDPSVLTEEERFERFGQNDHKRVFGMKADQFIAEAGFKVERIDWKDYLDEICRWQV